MIAATRQDMQTALDRAKNSILGNMFSRSDAQAIVTQLRSSILQDLHEMHAENQQAIRSAQAHRLQMTTRIANLEREVGVLQQILSRILDQQSRAINMLQR
jgi:hypothetical protein